MTKGRSKHSPSFKAKVALEAASNVPVAGFSVELYCQEMRFQYLSSDR